MESSENKAASTVKSAKRVMEIFELFDEVQLPMNLTDISTRLGYPAASALALLKSLQAMDYVSFNPNNKTYSPTMRIAMLGGWIQGQIFMNGTVVALMNDLAERTGETIMLGMQNDIHAQYVHTVQSGKALRYFLKPGTLRPICRSATGYALLANQTEAKVRKLVQKINLRQSPMEPAVDEESLMATLEAVRKQGYAYSDQLTEGISALAIALPQSVNGRAMALGLGGPTSRVQPKIDDLVQLMKKLIAHHLPSSGSDKAEAA
ncbi:IclR family transcriptional regulator [Noviherbaspirillum sp. Root189]|uniref:IclR family transcriptional regulator n=1 Tax=Noviherbaspirillum sp. Root189 TaxID=1736487 RepID=UPI000714506B|nr:IclR family transcriptional regulator [Noviherbaspirillum sp. Root189]KRB75747.1 hypothetical protein ASE07_26415 [Noviherbaspirillum sp. Root189]